MKITPVERAQLTALLGALGSGLSGSTGLSIFSNIEGDIQSRQQRAQAHKQALQDMLLQEQFQAQQAAAARQSSMQRFLMEQQIGAAQDQSKAHSSAIQDFMSNLIPELQPTDKTTTTLRTQIVTNPTTGKKTTVQLPETVTSTTPKLSFQSAMEQLGALGASIPGGLSKQEAKGLTGTIDKFYTASGKHFVQSIVASVHGGMAAGKTPAEITSAILAASAGKGWGSKDEQAHIRDMVNGMLQRNNYTGKGAKNGPVGPVVPPATGGAPIIGDLLNGIVGALGVGAVGAAAVKGTQIAKGMLQGSMADANLPGESSMVAGPRDLGLNVPENTAPRLAQALARAAQAPAGAVTPQDAQGAAANILGALKMAVAPEAAQSQMVQQLAGTGLGALGNIGGAQDVQTGSTGTGGLATDQLPRSPGGLDQFIESMRPQQQMQGPTSDVPPEAGAGALNALGALALPLQALDMFFQNRNAANFYKQWQTLSLADKQKWAQRSRYQGSLPAGTYVDPSSGNIVDAQGHIFDPYTGQISQGNFQA